MTKPNASTSRRNAYAKAQARIRMQDAVNTYACTRDERLLREMDRAFARCLELAEKPSGEPSAELWVDGSYNEHAGCAGIGVAVALDASKPGCDAAFGKPVRASGSAEAEIYAVGIGLSYLLDTYPDVRRVVLRYDCTAAAVTAANLQAYAGLGAPYTNLRSAMKRLEKAGVSVVFRHTKAHGSDWRNGLCDAIARYYSRAVLADRDMEKVAPWVKPARGRRAQGKPKERRHGNA